MSYTLAHSIPETAAKLCLHCGARILNGEASNFCCRGCATVYSLLKTRGLDSFYSIRDRAKNSEKSIAANSIDEDFTYLDDTEFLKDYAFDENLQMHFYLEGVHCAACVWLTEKLPEFVPGVEYLKLNLSSGVALVRLRKNGSFAKAAEEIVRLGYRPHPVKQGQSDELQQKENHKHLIQLGIAGMMAGNIMLLAIALYAGADGALAQTFRWMSFALYLPVILYSAIPFYRSAWASLRKWKVSIDVPIVMGLVVGTVASLVNLAIGSEHIYFDSLSALVFLLLSTRYLLKRMNQYALKATELIHFLTPSKARKRNLSLTNFQEVKTESLCEGDVIRVLPGECFPVDGEVIQGTSAVNCALLTGEAGLAFASPGTRVNAGTWNQLAPLEVRVLASGSGTRLGKILKAMEHGLANKSPIVSYLDRVGQAFVFLVLALTGVGFLLGLSVSGHEAVNRALAVAIVVCPCTFALATPLALSLAMSRCAQGGVLVKDAEIIERLSHIKNIYFDKTGTLTQGELQVTQWEEILPGAAEALLALESHSAHPISKAVQYYFRHLGESLPHVENFREHAGLGISGQVRGSNYEVRSLIELDMQQMDAHRIETPIALFRDGALAGTLLLADQIRPDSKMTIDRLRSLDIEIHLLSGDTSSAVQRVAMLTGIDKSKAIASASPEKKAKVVKNSIKSLMVGDGANDAIALASAYVGVAVQGGMEMSMRAAGVYNTKAGVFPIYSLIIVSRETMKIIRRNLVFAIFYNIIGVAIALTGHLNPLFAAVLMPASALTVFISTMIGTKRLRHAFTLNQQEGA